MADDAKGVVIVAIPEENDPVWQLSSEQVPHLTIAYLDDQAADLEQIALFVQHATSMFQPFWLEVDHRGELGPNQADVLFFKLNDPICGRLATFRHALLSNMNVARSYLSTDQFPVWTPHLTMGYPQTPAKPDTREYKGINTVHFDRIAVWAGNYDGPEFKLERKDLMSVGEDSVMHAYDPVKAHAYYEAHKKLVGRKPGKGSTDKPTQHDGPTNKHRTDAIAKNAKSGLSQEKRKAINEAANKSKAQLSKLTKDFRDWVNAHPKATAEEKAAQKAKVQVQRNAVVKNFKDTVARISTPPKPPAKKPAAARVVGALGSNVAAGIKHEDESKGATFLEVLDSFFAHNAMVADASDELTFEEYLEHFGVKGMRWGVRRERGSDGTVTGGKKSKKGKGEEDDDESTGSTKGGGGGGAHGTSKDPDFISADAERVIKTHMKEGHEMSTREMQEAVQRANWIKQYNDIFDPKVDPNKELQDKVAALELQKKYAQLNAELHPSKVKAVARFISRNAPGFDSLKKIDDATGNYVSGEIKNAFKQMIAANEQVKAQNASRPSRPSRPAPTSTASSRKSKRAKGAPEQVFDITDVRKPGTRFGDPSTPQLGRRS